MQSLDMPSPAARDGAAFVATSSPDVARLPNRMRADGEAVCAMISYYGPAQNNIKLRKPRNLLFKDVCSYRTYRLYDTGWDLSEYVLGETNRLLNLSGVLLK